MIFAGDVALGQRGVKLSIPIDLFKSPWLINLEGSLVRDGEKYVYRNGVYNDFQAIAELKSKINFSAFSIANNHILDAEPIHVTLENAEELGIPIVGAGKNLNDSKKEVDIDGYTIVSFGWACIECKIAGAQKEGVNPYRRSNITSTVQKLLAQKRNVICFFHWNYELEKFPQPYDRRLAMDLIDMGVEAVIGCHAHRVQPIEFYKGKPIVYGLGNFMFSQGYFFSGNLRFPQFCEDEYAFEINRDKYILHYLHYDHHENNLKYVKSVVVNENVDFEGKAQFSRYNSEEYERFFRINRVQRKFLPVFRADESVVGYMLKSMIIKVRGILINVLTKMNLKSRNREKRV